MIRRVMGSAMLAASLAGVAACGASGTKSVSAPPTVETMQASPQVTDAAAAQALADQVRLASCRRDVVLVTMALEGYYARHSAYPSTLRQLVSEGFLDSTSGRDITYNGKGPGAIRGLVRGCTALGSPSPNKALASPDTTLPPARGCSREATSVVTVKINPDTPVPDCVIVTGSQRLRVVNATSAFGQRGSVISVRFAGLPARTIDRDQSTTFAERFGDYLAVGEHFLKVSAFPGSNIVVWLR